MTPNDHAKIFNAYLSRLSQKDARRIFESVERAWKVSLDGSISTQIRYQQDEFNLVEEVLTSNVSEYDRTLIEGIIRKTLPPKAANEGMQNK